MPTGRNIKVTIEGPDRRGQNAEKKLEESQETAGP